MDRVQQQNYENQINNEFQLDDINEDDDAKLARVTKEEYQALVLSLEGKLFMHDDLVKVASKLMSNFTMDCGVWGRTYSEALGMSIGDVYYYHDYEIKKIEDMWLFEVKSVNCKSRDFSDPSFYQGLLAIDVMMSNEGVG